MSMVSPVKGYVSSGYGLRGGIKHAGMDIATGGVAAPVYAAFSGVISSIVRGRKRYQPASVGPVVAPGRSGDGLRVHNPDGEQQVYIHMSPLLDLQNGDRVVAGQLLGYVNLSGNTSGYHLHFECWNARRLTRNPLIDFRAFGIAPGSTPKKASTPAKPKPKPSPSKPKEPTVGIRGRLKKMGLPQTRAGVAQWQRAHGLVADGDWGDVSERYYQWVLSLQRYLNNWRNVKRYYPNGIPVDGYRGSTTRRAESYARAGATAGTPYRPPSEPPKRA